MARWFHDCLCVLSNLKIGLINVKMRNLNILSPNGKLGRLSYFLLCLLVYVFQLIDLALHKQFSGVLNPYTDQFFIVVFIILVDLLALWTKCCIVNKRLKDIGKSSWLLVLSLIPFVCFVFDIYLFLKKSDSNNYEDTSKNENNTNFKKAFCILFLINSFVEYYLFFYPFSSTDF